MTRLVFTLCFLIVLVQGLFAWNWPQCRNTNGCSPEQPTTIFLGDQKDFGCESWSTVNGKWPKWRVVINKSADIHNGINGSWSGYSNVDHKINTSPRFTSTGIWYWGMQVEYTDAGTTTGWYCHNNTSWDNMWGTPTSNLSVIVSPLNNPETQAASSASGSQINLSWAKDAQNHNVMIVRKLSSDSWTEPTQGTAYSVGQNIGSGVVVYNSNGITFSDTQLSASTAYDYKLYSENYSYYSTGVTASATTCPASQVNDYFRSKASGNWSNTATWESSSDNVNWLSATLVPGGAAKAITILSGHTVTLDQDVSVTLLTINSGAAFIAGEASPRILAATTLNVNAGARLTNNGNLTATTFNILSDATNGTGTFTDNGTTNTTTTNVQQYLTSGRNWFIASPVSGATSNVVKFNPSNRLWRYNDVDVTWDEITNTDTLLGVMNGYVVKPVANGVITFSGGALNTGAISISGLTRGTSGTKRGFHLVGNPYPSCVNWEAAFKTNLQSSMWYRTKNASTYVFETYNAATHIGTDNSGTAVTKYIPPMQAFWVRVDADGAIGTLGFDNTMRSHQSGIRLRSAESAEQQVLRLKVSNGVNSDVAIVVFEPGASDEYDKYDSPKMTNDNILIPEIYTMAGSEQVVINGLKSVADNTQLSLGFKAGQSDTYSIQATEISHFNADMKVVLVDKALHVEQDMTDGSVYSFTSDETNTTDRFSIVFRSSLIETGIQKVEDPGISIFRYGKGQFLVKVKGQTNEVGTITVTGLLGQRILTTRITGETTVLNTNLASGSYLITVKSDGKELIRKVVVY